MATITRYVNPGADAAGDGTTSNLNSGDSTHAYDSLNAWEAAEQADLTDAGGDVMVVNCAGTTADTTKCDITGWTTSVTNFITVAGEVATQVAYDSGRYRIEMTADAYDGLLESEQDGNILQDLQIQMTATSQATARCYNIETGTQEVRRCIAKGVISGTATFAMGFLLSQIGATDIKFRACLAYDFVGGDASDSGFRAQGGDDTADLQNCTAHNCQNGFITNFLDSTVQNCLAQDCVDGYGGTWTASGNQTNCSDINGDAPAPVTFGDVVFVDIANDDFTLSASDTVAKEKGTDLSGSFTYDLLNNTWPATWSCGALIPASAGGNPHGPFGHVLTGAFGGPI